MKWVITFVLLNLASLKLLSQQSKDTLVIKNILEHARNLVNVDLDSALKLAEKAYKLSQKASYQWGIAESLHRFGTVQSRFGNNDSAIKLFRIARSMRHQMNDKKSEAKSSANLSEVFMQKGNKDSALHYLYRALNLYTSISDSTKIGETYNDLSNFYFEYDDTKTALDFLSKSLPIFERTRDTLHLADTYTLYGIIYYYARKPELAKSYFLKTLEIDKKLNNDLQVARDLNYLGLCYDDSNNALESLSCFHKSLSFYYTYGEKPLIAEVLHNIGRHFYKRNLLDSAVIYYEKSSEVIQSTQSDELKLSIFLELAKIYTLKGNYAKAYDLQVKYADLNDTLLNKEKVNSIAEMQTKYETEKKEQQISLLGEQNKTRVAQRNFFIAGSVVLLLALFVLAFYYQQRQRLARKNEQIAQEKISGLLKEQEIKTYNAMIEGQEEERKRIAADLHDRLGSMLSTVKLMFSALNEKIDRNQDENVSQYTKTTNLLDEAVQEVRRVSHNLSTGMVNSFGLVTALEELCESIDKSGMIKCKLLSYGMEERLSQQIEIGLFRMVQELVNNTLKHAKAKHLTIQLNRNESSLNLTVEDDGVGFDVAEKRKNGGLGLKNLDMRAQKMEGTYAVDSRPGHGTISIIEIPLKAND